LPNPVTSQPKQSPVAFERRDTERADALIDRYGRLAALVIPEAPSDGTRLAKLIAVTRGGNAILADQRTVNGAKVGDLAKAANYASDKHLRDDPHGPWMRRWSAVAVRLLLAARVPLLVEHVASEATRVRRESRAIGHDHHASCAHVKPLLSVYAGTIDQHLVDWQSQLVSGTCFDHTQEDADCDRIAKAEEDLGEPLRGSVIDHVALALDERELCKQLVAEAAAKYPERFREAGLNPATVVERAFADLCVLETLPYGAPVEPGMTHTDVHTPGDDEVMIAAVSASMAGVASCGVIGDPAQLPGEWRDVTLESTTVAEWALEHDPWRHTFRTLNNDTLLRTETGPSGSVTEAWRVFGMANDDQRALALVQRASEAWTRECIDRAEKTCPVGLNYAKEPAFRMAMRAMLRLADAARVTAERERRASELAAHQATESPPDTRS
jgi:hypothetical protein